MTRALALSLSLLLALPAAAEQFAALGEVEVHYVVVNTLFLEPDVAARYGIVRGADRAILNVSVIGPDGKPRDASVEGTVRNLLEVQSPLAFQRIEEGEAIYFIAPLKVTDQDVLRFDVAVDDRRGNSGRVQFLERMWVDRQ
jgi:hypothetical protein